MDSQQQSSKNPSGNADQTDPAGVGVGADSGAPAPRALTVLGMLALTALTFSYLGSYAITTALVAEHVIAPWPVDRDPRPRWLLTTFCVLMLTFMAVGEVMRRLSKSELRQIDEMAEAGEEGG